MTSVPKAVADLNSGSIVARVDIAASPSRVFRALSSEEIVQWWGDSESYHAEHWIGDVRAGGTWRVEGKAADGTPYAVEGVYEAVEEPSLLVQTWKSSWDPGPVTKLTYRLEAIEGGTRVTVLHEGFAGRTESCEGHSIGWERVLSWLTGHLAGGRS